MSASGPSGPLVRLMEQKNHDTHLLVSSQPWVNFSPTLLLASPSVCVCVHVSMCILSRQKKMGVLNFINGFLIKIPD